MRRFMLTVLCALSLQAAPCEAAAAAAPPQDANVAAVDLAKAALALKFETQTGPKLETVDASDAKGLLEDLHPGDEVRVVLAPGEPRKVTGLTVRSVYVDWPARWIALGAAFLLLATLAGLASGGRILRFIVGADNRYSKSQTQFVLWSAMALSAYLATVFLRVWAGGLDYLGGVQITQSLLAISGLSAISFGAAKAITSTKTDAPGAPGKTQGTPRLLDLVRDDAGNPDLGDFQMMVVTATAAAIYFWSTFHFLGSIALSHAVTLPDVDAALLTGFGLGQGAYLAKKIALPVGKG